MGTVYVLIVFAVAAASVLWGFYRGFARQVSSLIGIAFGAISARLLGPGIEDILYGAFPSVHGKLEQTFVYETVSRVIVFCAIYFIFNTLTLFLDKILNRGEHTMLNNIGGAIFSLFKYLLTVSIAFNLIVALNRESELLRFVKSDDGNVIEEVMLISPALLGGEDVIELSNKIQLREAKKIS